MRYDELSDEQRAMLEGGSTPEEMLRLAQAEGYKLSDEELEQVVGGFGE